MHRPPVEVGQNLSYVESWIDIFRSRLEQLDMRDADARKTFELDAKVTARLLADMPPNTPETHQALAWVVALGSFLRPGKVKFNGRRWSRGRELSPQAAENAECASPDTQEG